jgi:membrane-associated phospholipid phosphatase
MLNKRFQNKLIWFIRNIGILITIIYWYPETYQLGKCTLPNLDHIFVAADQWLFCCQPSLEFCKIIPYTWFNELMNFGYLTYFIMIIGTSLFFFFSNQKLSQKTTVIILCSFLFYYIIFIILPVKGPQFYLPYPDNTIPDAGIFRELLKFIQETGEQPTGAFPSSHVGICLINLTLLFRYMRKGFFVLLPIAILLILSTVYIKAHYLIDVVAGFISAPLIYWLSISCWKKFEKSNTFVERIS